MFTRGKTGNPQERRVTKNENIRRKLSPLTVLYILLQAIKLQCQGISSVVGSVVIVSESRVSYHWDVSTLSKKKKKKGLKRVLALRK